MHYTILYRILYSTQLDTTLLACEGFNTVLVECELTIEIIAQIDPPTARTGLSSALPTAQVLVTGRTYGGS